MNIVFWNLNNQIRAMEVVALFDLYNCDIAVFAEYADEDAVILAGLQVRGIHCCFLPTVGCRRIKILVRSELDSFSVKRESERYTFREYSAPGKIPTLFCMIHFQSKLHMNNEEQLVEAGYLKSEIEEVESEVGHGNTIVFGDFNMNPFDAGMYFANAMNSVPCKHVAKSGARNIQGREHSFFYNPSWNLLGDRNEAPGSYYYGGGAYSRMHWNILDQIIMRPIISDRLDNNSLRVLTSIGADSLLSAMKRPRLSDHLPLFFSINLEFEAANEELMA